MFALPAAFAGLEPLDAEEVANHLQPLELGPSEEVCVQGDDDPTMAFVLSGSVGLTRDDARVGGVGAREMFGETELFCQVPRLHTGTTATHTHLLALTTDAYSSLCHLGNPGIFGLERQAIKNTSTRLNQFQQAFFELAQGDPYALPPAGGAGILSRLVNRLSSNPKLDALDVLTTSPLFSWADAVTLDQTTDVFTPVAIPAGSLLYRQGDTADRMYLIAEGAVDVMVMSNGKAENFATLGEGSIIGAESLGGGGVRTNTVVTTERVHALAMERSDFLGLFGADDPVGSVFRQGVVRGLSELMIKAMERYVIRRLAEEQLEMKRRQATPASMLWRD